MAGCRKNRRQTLQDTIRPMLLLVVTLQIYYKQCRMLWPNYFLQFRIDLFPINYSHDLCLSDGISQLSRGD